MLHGYVTVQAHIIPLAIPLDYTTIHLVNQNKTAIFESVILCIKLHEFQLQLAYSYTCMEKLLTMMMSLQPNEAYIAITAAQLRQQLSGIYCSYSQKLLRNKISVDFLGFKVPTKSSYNSINYMYLAMHMCRRQCIHKILSHIISVLGKFSKP